ncbi:unnamed protein product [Albugo candida]|nr:unnamed protein product [Albugo candida]|eukprot:CCI50407.1 unnamed protein product [Albugo candida]
MFEKWSLGVLSDCYLALEYALYRAEDEDAVLMRNDTSDLTCRLVVIESNSPFSLMAPALQQHEDQKLSSARQALMSALRQSGSGLLGPCLQMYTSLA